MEEVWKDIKGYEGLYRASNLGRIWSVRKNKLMWIGTDDAGYHRIFVNINKTRKWVPVHQLVYDAFNSDRQKGGDLVVDHINGIKTDNRPENLQLLTSDENVRKGIRMSRELPIGVVPKGKSFGAVIYINQKAKYLGTYETPDEALTAYLIAKDAVERDEEPKVKRILNRFDSDGYKVCSCCGEKKYYTDYYRTNRKYFSGMCKKCLCEDNKRKRRELKAQQEK